MVRHVSGFLCGMLLAFMVSACNRPVETQNFASLPHVDPALQAIDSLMWQQPDSALAVLLDYFARRDALNASPNASPKNDINDSIPRRNHRVSTTYNRHYAHLLLAELLYKNGYAQTNRAELLKAMAYYDSLAFALNDAPTPRSRHCGLDPQSPNSCDPFFFLAARAHYINGAGYYENDSTVEACQQYLKALDVMELHFEEKDLVGNKARFMALTYTRLTELFSNLYLHNPTIYFGKKSLDYYNKFASISWQKAWILTEIGSHYEMMDCFDTAYLLYEEALLSLPDTNNITYRDIKTYQTVLSYKTGGQPEKSIEQLRSIMVQAESDMEFYSRCMNIGEFYYHKSQFDSAWYYLNEVFHESPNVNSKKQAAEWLAKLCKTQGKETDAIEYAGFLVPFANVEENQSDIKSKLTEFYKSYTQQEQMRLHRHEKLKNQRRLMVLTGGFVALMSSTIILYHKSKRRKLRLEEEIESERRIHKMQQKALSGKLKKSNEALLNVMRQLDANSASGRTREPNRDFNSFTDTPICREILETVHQQCFKSKIDYLNYKEYALTKNQLLALRDAANENMDNFTYRIRKRFHSLTDEDATYCCFYLLDITDAEIAALMQKAYPTVCERKRKIKRIVGENANLSFFFRTLP